MNDQPKHSDGKAPSWPTLLFGRRARIIWTISLGVAIQAFGWFLVSTIMPSVVLELGSPHLLSWGTTAFLALSIPGSACAGFLKGRYGTRHVGSEPSDDPRGRPRLEQMWLPFPKQ